MMKSASIDRQNASGAQGANQQKELPDIQSRPVPIQHQQSNQGGQSGTGASATPQSASNQVQLNVITNSSPYSVTNKTGGSLGAQLPIPGQRSTQAEPNSAARHSKLRNGASNQGQLQQLNIGSSAKAASKKSSINRENNFNVNELPQKQVKPSELSLDLIIPSSIRGAKQSPMSGAKQSNSLHNSSVNTSMLVNLRTPQNNQGMLQPIAHQQQMKKKELQDLLTNHDQSYQSLQQSLNIYAKSGAAQNKIYNRNQPPRIHAPDAAAAANQNDQLQSLIANKDAGGLRGQYGHVHLLQGQAQMGASTGSVYQGKLGPSSNKHRGNSVDALNNSVEMRSKIHMMGAKQQKHVREKSVRISRFNNSGSDGESSLLNNSVHDFERTKNKAADHLESLSVSGSHHQAKIKELSKEVNIRKDRDSSKHLVTPAQTAQEAQQAGEEGEKLNKDVQLNLQNLIQIDEKLTTLADYLKKNTFQNVSQLCSEWWEHTDEDDYTIAKFFKAYKEERARREIKQLMCIEILSIAIVNYFTSSPEIFRPSNAQLNQVRVLFNNVHQNFLAVTEFIFSKLPSEALHNQFAQKIQHILKTKKKKPAKQQASKTIDVSSNSPGAATGINAIKQYNESIINYLKTISRQGVQAASNTRGGNLSPKKLIALRNQGMLKNQLLIQSQALKPLYQTVTNMIKQMESVKINQVREAIIRSSETIEDLKLAAKQMLPPLYGVGGTAIGGYEPLPVVQPPYLPEAKDPNCYTLVLDLDETLVHYYEVKGEGNFRIRPGCEKFLKEMAEIYEVVIFTAAMQDYADWVLDSIDRPGYISYRLYRQHASPTGMVFVKDLSRIGRPLHKTIIVDNVAENFSLQPDNGIFIKSWFEDPSDTALHELAPLLKQIVEKKVKDVREALRKFRDQMLEQIQKGVTNPQLCL